MTFLDRLKTHIGGLVLIKSQLYWYDSRVWDGIEGRVCLLLDTFDPDPDCIKYAPIVAHSGGNEQGGASILLDLDGTSKWIWVYSDVVEFISDGDQ